MDCLVRGEGLIAKIPGTSNYYILSISGLGFGSLRNEYRIERDRERERERKKERERERESERKYV